jgi:hypothetical protein
MQRQAAGFWKYERLTRSQFLGIGTVKSPRSSHLLQGASAKEEVSLQVTADIFEVRSA